MEIWKQRLAWSPNFIRAFGMLDGLRLLMTLITPLAKNGPPCEHRVPGYASPITLRRSIADHATFKQCMVMKQYDFSSFPQAERLMADYQALLAKGITPLIIDAGANIGLATLWFANLFPQAKIASIEPDQDNFALLVRNTKHLGSKVLPINAGIWDHSTRLEIVNPNSGSASFRVQEVPAGQAGGVPALSIGDICRQAGAAHPFIVKMDIEGAQANVFQDHTEWVAKTHLITLELDDWLLPWQGTSRNFFRCLSLYPFDYLLHKESIFCFQDMSNQRASDTTRPD